MNDLAVLLILRERIDFNFARSKAKISSHLHDKQFSNRKTSSEMKQIAKGQCFDEI